MSSQFQAYAAIFVAMASMIATAFFTKIRLQRRQDRHRQEAAERAAKEKPKDEFAWRPTLIIGDRTMAQLNERGLYFMQLAEVTNPAKAGPLADQLTDEERAAP